jgi:dipeptidyl aminopeptidase/acylaminoacyl peptidase
MPFSNWIVLLNAAHSASVRSLLAAAPGLLLLLCVAVQAQQGYQKPPQAILDILHAPPTPLVSVSPTRDQLLLVDYVRYPDIAELAEPMLRLAGLRINPNTNGPYRPPRYTGLTLKSIAGGRERKIVVPANASLGFPVWSADGRHFALTNTTAKSIELWVGDVATGALRRLPGVTLNGVYGGGFEWLSDNRTLLCRTVVAGRGKPPVASPVPTGPTIQESFGKTSPIRTYQDLLQNAHDEDLFEYYATSRLKWADSLTGRSVALGKPGLFAFVAPSPDSRYLLVVRNHRPFSYLLPAFFFPKEVEIWDQQGKLVHTVASLPLEDQVPIEGVPIGPRAFAWRATEPATLLWVEALDEGDPKKKVPYRDSVQMQRAPFERAPVEVTRLEERYDGLTWGEKDGLAFVHDYEPDRRWTRTYQIDVDRPGQEKRLIWDRSSQDRYHDPGAPLMRRLPNGEEVMWQQGDALYLAGAGATPEGDRPFLDRFHLTTLQSERLFQTDAKSYETVVTLLADDASRFLTRYETDTEPPNYYLRAARGGAKTALTHFTDPTPQVRAIRKEIVTYRRADGVPLSFTLYLPPDYTPGRPLPTVVWAYPQEFAAADLAGQVSGSPNRFTTLTGISHLFFLTRGYAVLDGATMPVVGDRDTQNNTYVEQIVSSAQAAIDKAVAMGVTDRSRVGIGGHSYGAFMTANLLAHSNLFKAGIARSGAYNRTLTPFGFQSERRTLWEAPEMYLKVSPLMYAHQIKAPLLLIHGEADNNPGTFPLQSERLYQAIQGNGGHVRLVMLPLESHGYSAQESVEHTLYEMVAWFDKYVRQATPSAGAGSRP